MATFRYRNKKWRVEVARRGVRKTASFVTKAQGVLWAAKVEAEIIQADEQAKKFSRSSINPLRDLLSPKEIIEKSSPAMFVSGVYFLIDEGRITYVGKSNNIGARLVEHAKKGRPFERYFALLCSPDKMHGLESDYIKALDPEQNKTPLPNLYQTAPKT